MYLQEIKIVDLRTSKWDKAKSDPAKGEFQFTDKRYINYRGDRAAAPPWKFSWNRYNARDNYRDVRDWQTKYKASFVTPEDGYWPEGVIPQNGIYVEGDAVLMKIPVMEYAKKRKAEIERSETRPNAIKAQWNAELRNLGLEVSESELEKTNPHK